MVIDFKEESEFSQESYTLNEIVLRHIRKISDLCCSELTGGYWNKKPMQTKSGIVFTEEYHEDKREAYCNSVNFLIDVIYPKGDKKLKEFIDKNDNEKGDVKERIKLKRNIFKEINKMFERTNFFNSSGSVSE